METKLIINELLTIQPKDKEDIKKLSGSTSHYNHLKGKNELSNGPKAITSLCVLP